MVDHAARVPRGAALDLLGGGAAVALGAARTHQLGVGGRVEIGNAVGSVHVIADVVSTDTNNVTVTFATAPASNAYRVTVIG